MAKQKLSKGQRAFLMIREAAKHSLGANEMWCILHPEGPLEETASTDFTRPVWIICNALQADWDDLQESGFYLGKIIREAS